MKTISVSVSEDDYEAFRAFSSRHNRSIADLVRQAMTHYRREHLTVLHRLDKIKVVSGPRPISPLPSREELADEMSDRHF